MSTPCCSAWERYDVIVTAKDGVFPWSPQPKARTPWPARCCPPPPAAHRPDVPADGVDRAGGHRGHLLRHRQVQLPTTSDLDLQTRRDRHDDGLRLDDQRPALRSDQALTIHEGQHATLTFTNNTMMWHPMHLAATPSRSSKPTAPGPRKDTVIVVTDANRGGQAGRRQPGIWMLHCHNVITWTPG